MKKEDVKTFLRLEIEIEEKALELAKEYLGPIVRSIYLECVEEGQLWFRYSEKGTSCVDDYQLLLPVECLWEPNWIEVKKEKDKQAEEKRRRRQKELIAQQNKRAKESRRKRFLELREEFEDE